MTFNGNTYASWPRRTFSTFWPLAVRCITAAAIIDILGRLTVTISVQVPAGDSVSPITTRRAILAGIALNPLEATRSRWSD
jgi:hypothetical protein